MHNDVAIIGSGPGAALTAALLAENGLSTTIIEAGEKFPLNSSEPFSQQEMVQKYKNGGITIAMGRPKVAYVEGSCVGGGSEINSGLYHRPPADLLEKWVKEFQINDLSYESLTPHFEENERDISVCLAPQNAIPLASTKLHNGAQALGWSSLEVPRWFKYKSDSSGIKQSMSETMIPRALNAGALLLPKTKITKISQLGGEWLLEGVAENNFINEKFSYKAKNVFVCAGAIGTPALLQRSKLSKLAGRSLHMHPSVKIVARFKDIVNDEKMGVPVHQVKEFSPRFSFGCSISSVPHLSLAMMDIPDGLQITQKYWRNMAIYYSMVTNGKGSVSNTFLGDDPLVRFELGKEGISNTIEGMLKLAECLFAAGAIELYPAVRNSNPIKNMEEMHTLCNQIKTMQLNVMTIHLFSSCPMGENLAKCVTNSFGAVHGHSNLYINDASIIPTALGVNPQGTIMAITRRNVAQFLKNNL